MIVSNYPENAIPSFYTQVSMGTQPGYSMVIVTGENPDVDTGVYEDLWPQGGTIPYPSSATTMTISSTSALDTLLGTGARTVLISGLDASYNPITETVNLNGLTPVTTTNSFLRINRLAVSSAGTGLTSAGIIYIGTGVVTLGVPAVVYDLISAGINDSLSFSYTVPAGYTGYLLYARLTVGQDTGTTGCTARLIVTSASNNIQMVTSIADLNNGTVPFQPPIPVRLPEKTRLSSTAIGAAINNRVGAIAQIMLVQN